MLLAVCLTNKKQKRLHRKTSDGDLQTASETMKALTRRNWVRRYENTRTRKFWDAVCAAHHTKLWGEGKVRMTRSVSFDLTPLQKFPFSRQCLVLLTCFDDRQKEPPQQLNHFSQFGCAFQAILAQEGAPLRLLAFVIDEFIG